MTRLIVSFFFVAFQEDDHGQAVATSEPTQVASQEDAVRFAKLEPTSIGVVAWSRRAEPAIGEIGPPVVVYNAGKIGDFD